MTWRTGWDVRGLNSLCERKRAALLLAVSGIILVYTASIVYAPPHVSLAVLDETYLGDTVVVESTVSGYSPQEGVQFLTLQDGDTRFSAVYFGNNALPIDAGERYRMVGEVDVYEGELQIIVRQIQPANVS